MPAAMKSPPTRDRCRIAVIGHSKSDCQAVGQLLAAIGFPTCSDGFPTCSDAFLEDQPQTDADCPRLIILQLDGDGTSAHTRARLEQCRNACRAPVLGLVGASEDLDAHALAELRLDDYLFMPIRPFELAVRIRLLLPGSGAIGGPPLVERRRDGRRRDDWAGSAPSSNESDILVDEAAKCVRLRGRPLRLSPREYELVRLLASQPGRVFSSDEIVSRLWPKSRSAVSADVYQYIYLLRQKIETDPARPRLIVTVKGFGYMLSHPSDR